MDWISIFCSVQEFSLVVDDFYGLFSNHILGMGDVPILQRVIAKRSEENACFSFMFTMFARQQLPNLSLQILSTNKMIKQPLF